MTIPSVSTLSVVSKDPFVVLASSVGCIDLWGSPRSPVCYFGVEEFRFQSVSFWGVVFPGNVDASFVGCHFVCRQENFSLVFFPDLH